MQIVNDISATRAHSGETLISSSILLINILHGLFLRKEKICIAGNDLAVVPLVAHNGDNIVRMQKLILLSASFLIPSHLSPGRPGGDTLLRAR
jgi:hypothetical protein